MSTRNAALRLAEEGIIGGLAERFHGAPTGYSHRKTMERDAPQLLTRIMDHGADAALLTAL
ncbi:MAG TPA: hypothetical protein VMX97_07305 [Hyphomicrobiaceae bacterium]|nr:hypothetical protein [Hyphomicrobiaceae bacterium]